MPKLLYVTNFNPAVGREALADLFGCYGTVRSAAVVSRKETPGAIGTGLVEMGSDAECDAAITALNGAMYCGSALGIARAQPGQGRGLRLTGMLQTVDIPRQGAGRRITGRWGRGIIAPP